MTSPLRLVVCSPRFAPEIGGAETWTHFVALELHRRGHQVSAVARAARGCEVRHVVDDLVVERISGGMGSYWRGAVTAVLKAEPDVVIAQYSMVPPSVLAAARAKIPAVAVVHDVYGLAESVRIKGLATGVARHVGLERSLRWLRPDGFVVPSEATATKLRAFIRNDTVTVARPGSDHVSGAGRADRDSDQVLFVGRLVRQKGVFDLIAAVRMLVESGRQVHAVVVGTGPDARALRDRAGDLGEAFRMVGAIDDAALAAEMRRSRVLVLPSTREGWGLAITEASARGLPYVAYDIPAVREQHLLVGGGLLVPVGPRHLAEGIRRLLDEPLEADAFAARGMAVAATMTWTSCADAVEGAVVQAIDRRRERERQSHSADDHP